MNNDDRAKLEALPAFDDPHVQIVYRILCDTDLVPPPDEHWEGFTARHVVAALASAQAASAEPVAWIVYALHEGEMTPQYPACNTKLVAEHHARMFVADAQAEVRALYTTPAPAVAPAAVTDPQVSEALGDARKAIKCLFLEAPAEVVAAAAAKVEWAFSMLQAARTPEPPISLDWTEDEQWVRSQLQRMILSSRVLVGSDGTVTGYQIKTGALHKLIGRFAVNVPLGLPEVAASPTPDEQRAQAAQEDVRLLKAIRAEAAGYFGYDMRDHKTASDQAFELFGKFVAEQLRTALAGRQL